MTCTYSSQVSTVKLLGLVRLLKSWRASVYKLVFREILIFLVLYCAVRCLYQFGLADPYKRTFEKLVVYSGSCENHMPVTFVLGFYVSVVVQRWWSQYMNIGWPDRIMAYISVLEVGRDTHSRLLRRTMIRYLMLSEVLLLMNVSAPVKKRFPNLESLVAQGLMTKDELKVYNDNRVPHIANKYWIPCHWCAILMGRARDEKRIRDSFELIKLLEELTDYKNCLKAVFSYDWVSLPLVYTQVATLAVYAFFFTAVISRQFISYEAVRTEFDEDTAIRYACDMYVPLETIMQLFFYLGWLKVAEQMLNPFGEDDDDFECNFILDRNLKVGLFSVDQALTMQPKLQRDVWWDSEDPSLDYTEASKKFEMPDGWFGSTADLAVPLETATPIHPRLTSIPEASVAAVMAEATEAVEAAPEGEDSVDGRRRNGRAAGPGSQRKLPSTMSATDVSSVGALHRRFPTHAKRGRRRIQTSAIASPSTRSDFVAFAGGRRSSSSGVTRHRRGFGSTPDARIHRDDDGDYDDDEDSDKERPGDILPLVDQRPV